MPAYEKGDPRGPAVSARVAPVKQISLSPGQKPVDRRVHIQMIGLLSPRHHYVGAPKEPDQDTAGHFEQRVAVG